ncbi:DNA-binding transcriptional ArsR family regulator [Hamadaea flava]|uniref:DUF5937 family protein n=1 Tax=Hamadaea flava TaxID=1742688 RepID=A0ABV8LWW7_9ACTN|nr:DUF5937 family protein [Hamadaea flava]MCP2321699.1 DNA-binding transcriptional ArsR family regulator [Hamadaea flava]
MPRLEFSGPDLGRVRFAIMPFQETLKAARGLALPATPAGLAGWRHATLPRLPAAARPALALCGAHSRHLPDFLTPQPPTGPLTFDDELAAALADPGLPVEDDTLSFRSVLRTPSKLVEDLLAAPDRGRRALAASFTALHRAVLAADWPRLHAQLAADVAGRARTAARHGVEAMLAGLAPGLVRWSHPFLEYAGPPAPDHQLAGRGLVLVPSMFLTDAVHRQLNDRQQPMLFYPARTAAEFWRDGRVADGRLAGPVGEPRARILRLLAERPLGTGELAAELGVAPSTASEHLAGLRRAGLVVTTRSGRDASHQPTALAWSLLDVYIG